jgi:hypothetical protein
MWSSQRTSPLAVSPATQGHLQIFSSFIVLGRRLDYRFDYTEVKKAPHDLLIPRAVTSSNQDLLRLVVDSKYLSTTSPELARVCKNPSANCPSVSLRGPSYLSRPILVGRDRTKVDMGTNAPRRASYSLVQLEARCKVSLAPSPSLN